MNEARPLASPRACRPLRRALTAAYPLALVFAAGGAWAGAPPGEAPQGKPPKGEAPPAESSWTEAPRATASEAVPKVETNVVTPKAAPPKTERKAGAPTAETKAGAPKAEAYALGWTRLAGGEPCIGTRDLALSVEKALGQRAFVSVARADRIIEGRIGPRFGGGWEATVQVVDAQGAVAGTREFSTEGPDCRELDDTITLSVALLVAPSASAASADAAPEPGPGAKAAPPPREAAPKPRRDERFEASLAAGYVFGDRIFPHPNARGDGLGPGVGARVGYAFRSGLWLGASYTYFDGGGANVDPVETSPEYWSLGIRRFRAHVVGPEFGYRFALGPFQATPYVGFGPAIFDFADGSTRLARYESSPGIFSPFTAFAAWPGLALTLPLGEKLFVGADARWVMIAGAPAQNNVGAFGHAGLRF